MNFAGDKVFGWSGGCNRRNILTVAGTNF